MDENKNQNDLKEEDLLDENLHPFARYTECNEDQNNRIKLVRYMFSEIYKSIEMLCKDGRESQLGLQRLEEAQFWLIKGISREGNQNGKQKA